MPVQPPPINRQAVVIIHGMGEHRPNATIRGFARCLLKKITGDPELIAFEKPDKMSGTFETRSKTILRDQTVGRPTTHIFEFYWAQHMRDNTWGQVLRWMGRLLGCPPGKVPPRLRKVYYTLWFLLVLTVALVLVDHYTSWFNWYHRIGWLAVLLVGLWRLLQSAIVHSLGDAARYMSDNPDNIAQRQVIRKEGVELLRHLHEAEDEFGQPLYHRVIVAGHSLGTVVAYDLLRLAWVEYSETYDKTIPPFTNTVLSKMEAPGYLVGDDYQQDQYACWKAQRKAGNRWLVTDLVTMGAPLAYFDYLIVGSKTEFDRRKQEREYPTCPPVQDATYGLHWPVPRPPGYATNTINLLSYSSLFANTRWTNLYFETDFIGGPLKPVLGQGIDDREIPVPGAWFKSLFPYPFGHTEYWSDKPSVYEKAMDAIAAALHLNCNETE